MCPPEKPRVPVSLNRIVIAAGLIAGWAPALLSGAGAQPAAPASGAAVRQLADEVRNLGWLCYAARSERGDWDLFVCRPDGSDRRNLTLTSECNEFSPQFSRDGRNLLYRRVPRSEVFDRNRYGEQGELVWANRDGSDARGFGKAGEYAWASWSPDAQQIACLSIKGVFFVELASQQVRRTLPRQGMFQQLTWSPDGQWLVGVANSFGTGWSVARMNATTGQASAVNTVDCCTPDWFPDSRQVVFSWRPPGQKANQGYGWTQLWRADGEGRSRQLVYGEDGRHVYGGHVSPDGQYVLFTGNQEEDGDPDHAGAPMVLLRLSDSPMIGGESWELRARHPNAKDGPVLSLPVGWEPCWASGEMPGAATSAPLQVPLTPALSLPTGEGDRATPLGSERTIAEPERPSDLARELHELGWLAFSARSERGDWDLFRMRPDGSERRNLTNTREFNEAGARFSPDGTRLLYYRLPKGEPVDNNTYGTFELVVANADGSTPLVLGNEFPWASWGPDGRQLACLAPKGIRIVDVATRSVVREFPRQGIVSQLVWSPDGQRFAGTANGLGPFWNIGCLNPKTGTIRAVSETERYNCTPDWMPDSRGIVYARGIIPQQPGHAELWVANADGTERWRVYAEAGHHLYGACASPDGRHLLFTRSVEDLGQVPAIEMAIIRWSQASTNLAGPVPRLDLGPGWEPHWTAQAKLP